MKNAAPSLNRLVSLDKDFKSRKDYEQCLEAHQQTLLQIQQALFRTNERAIVVFEGPDASGKGGVIRRATQWLDPRGFRVHAVGAPRAEEQGRHYLWRFFQHLPPPGRIAIFDRSWYGRVLVERVEELTEESAWRRAYREIKEFERWLIDDGVRLCKVYLSIDRKEQDRRFEERLSNPRKYWKLTEEDIRNRLRWDDYSAAADEMFQETHTKKAPWHLIDGRHKWRTRVHVLGLLCDVLSEGLDIEPPSVDPELLRAARIELGLDLEDSLPETSSSSKS
ncbi:MAG: polyphosphate kinase [Halieaceae bacterium]|jgi:polyphosphate kinase 2 (PPK2 family)|nr:polyphosphate kinase [Halieaceae bacterium]